MYIYISYIYRYIDLATCTHNALIIWSLAYGVSLQKANMLPPNFEESTRAASERLDKGELGIDAALDDVLRGLRKTCLIDMRQY